MGGKICPACGGAVSPEANFCIYCGVSLRDGSMEQRQENQSEIIQEENAVSKKLMPQCIGGQEQGGKDREIPLTMPSFSEEKAKEKRGRRIQKRALLALCVAIAAVLLIVIVVQVTDRPAELTTGNDTGKMVNFSTIYYQFLDSSYASVATDGSYLLIDTNPNDYDDYTDEAAIQGLFLTITSLGLPDSLVQKMSSTRALDGRQHEEYDDLEVEWSYHPDKGLEVLFTTE